MKGTKLVVGLLVGSLLVAGSGVAIVVTIGVLGGYAQGEVEDKVALASTFADSPQDGVAEVDRRAADLVADPAPLAALQVAGGLAGSTATALMLQVEHGAATCFRDEELGVLPATFGALTQRCQDTLHTTPSPALELPAAPDAAEGAVALVGGVTAGAAAAAAGATSLGSSIANFVVSAAEGDLGVARSVVDAADNLAATTIDQPSAGVSEASNAGASALAGAGLAAPAAMLAGAGATASETLAGAGL